LHKNYNKIITITLRVPKFCLKNHTTQIEFDCDRKSEKFDGDAGHLRFTNSLPMHLRRDEQFLVNLLTPFVEIRL